METDVGALSASELAGATKAEVERLVGLGVLVARDGAGPFRAVDVAKVRLAVACERAGRAADGGIAAAIRAGRLSLAFLVKGSSGRCGCWKPAGRDVWLGSSPLETGL
jgi:hypothetical protein